MTFCKRLLICCLLLLPALRGAAANLVQNGNFDAVSQGQPEGWGFKNGTTLETEGENRFMRLKTPSPGEQVLVYKRVDLKSDVKALELKYRVRHEGIARGEKAWFDGRIMMSFRDSGGNEVKPSPKHPNFLGTSKADPKAKAGGPAAWVDRSQQFRVPEGAAYLEILFTLFNAKAGTLDFDDISLTAYPVAEIDRAEKEAAEKEAARIAALPKPKPKVAVPPADKLPKMIRVEGNRLKDTEGKEVWLQGVAIPSMEWSAGGENILKSIEVAITGWKANCIRLPIKSNFWNGVGPYQRDGGMQYRQTVDDAVNLCATHGVYLVIDLHEYRAPTQKHAEFWQVVAAKYANHPAVLFDLLNEPHDVSWDIWRNGGRVTDKQKDGKVLNENQQKLAGFDSIGMQKLVDTVRATGAKNVVIAGGLDWAYDLSGILNGYALSDATGNGVMYSTHVYPWKSDWKNKFLAIAEKHPIFMGEVGADEERMSFIPPERHEDPHVWVPDMLGVIQKHRLNWTAWSFHPKASPRALADWDYTPTSFWGAYVKRALAGESFETKKLR